MSTDGKTRPAIAHVLHRLEYAGAEVLAAALSRKLRNQYRWLFFCLDAVGPLGEQLRSQGFEVFNLNRRPGVDWSVARQMSKLCKRHHVDLLHAHQYTPFFYASMSRCMSSRPKLLFTEHGRHYPDLPSWKRIIANKWLLRRSDHVTAVGNFVRDALVRNEGMPVSRIDVIHNGIDPQRFAMTNRPTHRAAIREELGLHDTQPMVLQVARFHPVKDHATSIQALAHVVQQLPDAVLVLAGGGEQRSAMELLAGQLGLVDRIKFVGVRTDVDRLMAAADIFTLSSLSEGISVTLLEAMAGGLAIAATNVGGNGEVVEHNVTGLLSPRRDAAALGENLLKLLRDASLRQRMGAAGKQRFFDRFTEQQMHEGYRDLYDRLTQ